ncbi:MAG: hypothetical protein RhofKO_05730 [Rhodothermales bacterium]
MDAAVVLKSNELMRTLPLLALTIMLGCQPATDGPRPSPEPEATLLAAEPMVMPLWDGEPLGGLVDAADTPELTVYLPPEDQHTGAAVVILPGGGYKMLAKDHEGHDVARWLNSHGIAGIMATYRRGEAYRHPVPLMDAQRAIQTVRARASEWGIDAERVGILGFSAGGHLASTTGTHFDESFGPDDAMATQSARPDFMLLLYPVISLTTEYTHQGSKWHLLGDEPDPELVERLSSELQVTPETPPTFLFHTNDDTAVPPENSVMFYQALRRAGVPAEMHIYEPGHHGLGLAPEHPTVHTWPDLAINWLRHRGVIE